MRTGCWNRVRPKLGEEVARKACGIYEPPQLSVVGQIIFQNTFELIGHYMVDSMIQNYCLVDFAYAAIRKHTLIVCDVRQCLGK